MTKQQGELQSVRATLSKLSLQKQTDNVRKQQRILKQREETLLEAINRIESTPEKVIANKFEAESEEAGGGIAKQNAVFGVGSTSAIRDLEVGAIEAVATTIAVDVIITPTWRELSRFLPDADPRQLHLALDGTKPDALGLFNVGGTLVNKPRDPRLPVEESVNCRCELEYSF